MCYFATLVCRPHPHPSASAASQELQASPGKTTIVFVREDKKQIPFNFVNTAIANWEILQHVDHKSFIRISKGTVIKAVVTSDKLKEYHSSNKKCTINDVSYETYAPKTYTPFLGELYLNLTDLEDKSILAMTPSELLQNLQTPGNRDNNTILSVDKIYPKKTISSSREQNAYTAIRVSIIFSNHIPERVYFQNVSVPIAEYILPPKRCFTCQRLGHSSISCKRKVTCPNCAEPHSFDHCKVTNKEELNVLPANKTTKHHPFHVNSINKVL